MTQRLTTRATSMAARPVDLTARTVPLTDYRPVTLIEHVRARQEKPATRARQRYEFGLRVAARTR